MSEEDSPRPFRRERNLSNRNFRRRGSNRRFSTESHSSIDSHSTETDTNGNTNNNSTNSTSISSPSVSSSFQYSYSVNTDTENGFKQKSLRLLRVDSEDTAAPPSPDPALLDVKQKVKRFETLTSEERIIFKTGKFNSRQRMVTTGKGGGILGPLRVLPIIQSSSDVENNSPPIGGSSTPATPTVAPELPMSSPPILPLQMPRKQISSLYSSIDEARSEDEVEDISSDFVEDETATDERPLDTLDSASEIIPAIEVEEFDATDKMRRTHSAEASLKEINSEHSSESVTAESAKKGSNNFPRNYRSTPRPKTEIIGTTNRPLVNKYNSFHVKNDNEQEEEEEEIELRDKCAKHIQPILDELINTEETYVESLFNGIKNYGNIFTRKDLPLALQGKKYVLLGNIEQIAEFHRDEFLPMLLRNRRDIKRLFDEFQDFIEQNCFYGYVIFTMNKQKSLKLCDDNKTYFKHLQSELDDKLGINSFLVQPIQRISKYPLLLKEFISSLFKNRDYVMKPIIESCCRLDKKIRTLLTTTNESEVINDVVDCHEFNVFCQGKFRKVSEFNIIDHTLRRTYRGKVFIFDKCIIYTEIKGKSLVFHGRYPCEHIGIVAKTKHFTLFYQRRKLQEADFHADPAQIELWLDLIREMISSYAVEERRKLQEMYSRESDHKHRVPSSLVLFRDSNRFSSDSGIGNIWVMPKPEPAEDALSNRTTWYQ